jgi:hypothetical protein
MATIDFYSGGRVMTGNYSEKVKANLDRTDMETGPAKTRPRQSLTTIERPVTYLFTAVEKAAFKTWFKTTAKYGSLWFNWVDPDDGVTKDARIVDGAPDFKGLNVKLSHWYCTLNIETEY